MLTHDTVIRVRYGETDQMGYAYYGNYAYYYEIGRTELLRKTGITYREIEEAGYLMPVTSMRSRFIRPAMYDSEITIKTTMREMPVKRFEFRYELFNEKGEMINAEETTLVLLSATDKSRCALPGFLENALKPYFS